MVSNTGSTTTYKTNLGFHNAEAENLLSHNEVAGSLENCPIIAAINNLEAFETALTSPPRALYILTGNPLTLPGMLQRAHEHGKTCLLNMDFLDGLARDRAAVEFLAAHHTDGIVSTRFEMLKAAQSFGMMTVQRTFAIDSAAVTAAGKTLAQFIPTAIEVLPAIAAPKVAKMLAAEHPRVKVIGGGLIECVREIENLLASGISSVTTSDSRLWVI